MFLFQEIDISIKYYLPRKINGKSISISKSCRVVHAATFINNIIINSGSTTPAVLYKSGAIDCSTQSMKSLPRSRSPSFMRPAGRCGSNYTPRRLHRSCICPRVANASVSSKCSMPTSRCIKDTVRNKRNHFYI